jgi:long-subunit acyl-CoA synthetase (AMP-forming)
VATGGAPTAPEVRQFITYLFPDANFHESYGATEVGAITENGQLRAGVDFKLVDLPALGFTNADRPFARGEIVVRTPTQASGYYRTPQLTAEAFKDGWFHTGPSSTVVSVRTVLTAVNRCAGDLGMIDDKKQIHVLERVSAVTALHGGLMICPSKLEALFESSKLVQNVLLLQATMFCAVGCSQSIVV